jgi:hypothetical protein
VNEEFCGTKNTATEKEAIYPNNLKMCGICHFEVVWVYLSIAQCKARKYSSADEISMLLKHFVTYHVKTKAQVIGDECTWPQTRSPRVAGKRGNLATHHNGAKCKTPPARGFQPLQRPISP